MIAALCCLGVAPVLAALSAVGLGFLIRDAILVPILIVILGATIWGLRADRRRHGRTAPLAIASAGAVLTVAGLWVSPFVVAAGLAALLAGSAWNWRLITVTRNRVWAARDAR